MGCVDPWVVLTHGLGWVGSRWVEIFQFLVGWVGSTIAKVLKFEARLDESWLHQAAKFVSCIGLGRVWSNFFHLLWVGLGTIRYDTRCWVVSIS